MTPPTSRLVPNSTLGLSKLPVRLSWTGSDSTSGMATYQVQGRRFRSGSWGSWGWTTQGTKATTLISAPPPGTYQFRVRGADKASNWSAWKVGWSLTVSTYQENSNTVSYPSGVWQRAPLANSYGGYVSHSSARGATTRVAIPRGVRQVGWISGRSIDRGRAKLYLDGVRVVTLELYSSAAQAGRVVYIRGVDRTVGHTLEVRLLGTRNVSSKGTRVDVDGFVLLR